MIFELIDSKKICDSMFADGKILPFTDASDLTHTWDYSPLMGDSKYELACLYAGTKNIQDACSNESRERYLAIRERLKSFLRSFITAQISLSENCFFDLVPLSFIEEYFTVRKHLIQEIFDTYPRPENYEHQYELNKLLHTIADKPVMLNYKNLEQGTAKNQLNHQKSTDKFGKYTKYNIYGAITGRLSTESDSFPALRLPKDLRCLVEPTNDFFLEIDFNSFEPRIMLALNEQQQPTIDLHEWNKDNIFVGLLSRDEAKKKFLAWLYDEKGNHILTPNQDKKALTYYDKFSVKKKYYDGNMVKNYYGREIIADAEHALNYIVQSTAADVFLRQSLKVDCLLTGRKSFVKFLVHDAVVIDMALEDKHLASKIFDAFSDTDFGKFLISKKVGKNYGNMRDL